jgi:glycosyltransferase involved in cell wall biosynthesis
VRFVPTRVYEASQRILLRTLSSRYEFYYCYHLPLLRSFRGLVIVDIDDARFTNDEVQALNDPKIIAVVTTTDVIRQRYLSEGVHKPIVVIPSGYGQKDINAAKVNAIAKRYNPLGHPVVGCVAYTLKYKSTDEYSNVDLLIDAMELVWEHQPEVELWLLGRPDSTLKKYTEGERRVKLFGMIPHHDLINWEKNFTIGTYCRQQDSGGWFRVKLIEYMGCGIPVVATDVSETKIIDHANAGLLAGTSSGFAGAILKLLNNPLVYRKFADNSTAFSTVYDWDILVERYRKEVFEKYCL